LILSVTNTNHPAHPAPGNWGKAKLPSIPQQMRRFVLHKRIRSPTEGECEPTKLINNRWRPRQLLPILDREIYDISFRRSFVLRLQLGLGSNHMQALERTRSTGPSPMGISGSQLWVMGNSILTFPARAAPWSIRTRASAKGTCKFSGEKKRTCEEVAQSDSGWKCLPRVLNFSEK